MRLIDADDVIETISHYLGKKLYASYPNDKMPDFDKGVIDGYARARSIVFETPTVDPVKHGHWIPCSERLPDKEGSYLCTVGADYRNPREMIYEPDDFDNEDSNAWRSTDGYRVMNWFVIAWMPMPKPYEMDEVSE